MKKVFSCEKHPELAFYAGNKKYKFSAGKFVSEDKYVIGKLGKMADVVCEGDYDPSTEPKPEEDSLIKVIRAVVKEELAIALGEKEVAEEAEVAAEEAETEAEAETEDEDPFDE
jgi:hypothetical protein